MKNMIGFNFLRYFNLFKTIQTKTNRKKRKQKEKNKWFVLMDVITIFLV